jgi:cytochrome c
MRPAVAAGLCFTALVAISMPTSSTLGQQDRPALNRRGKALLSQKCAMCHAIGRKDRSRHSGAVPFRELASHYKLDAIEEALAEGIISGHPDMPELSFAPRDIGAIMSYLRAIQRR